MIIKPSCSTTPLPRRAKVIEEFQLDAVRYGNRSLDVDPISLNCIRRALESIKNSKDEGGV